MPEFSCSSLETEEHELKPEPGQHQHEHHVGERKAEPAGKVNNATIFREEPEEEIGEVETGGVEGCG